MDLQKARALKHQHRRLAARTTLPRRFIFLSDSSVCVGAFNKGRNYSLKLNGIQRSCMGHLIAGGHYLCLVWVCTSANAADRPSRGCELPAPVPAPAWLSAALAPPSRSQDGREFMSGSMGVTLVFQALGFAMGDAFDIKQSPGDNILDDGVLETLLSWVRFAVVFFIWLPPCSTFSALQNGHPDGPMALPGLSLWLWQWLRRLCETRCGFLVWNNRCPLTAGVR